MYYLLYTSHPPVDNDDFLAKRRIDSMAPIIYTPEGKTLSERLWQETITELSFAKVDDILRDING